MKESNSSRGEPSDRAFPGPIPGDICAPIRKVLPPKDQQSPRSFATPHQLRFGQNGPGDDMRCLCLAHPCRPRERQDQGSGMVLHQCHLPMTEARGDGCQGPVLALYFGLHGPPCRFREIHGKRTEIMIACIGREAIPRGFKKIAGSVQGRPPGGLGGGGGQKEKDDEERETVQTGGEA